MTICEIVDAEAAANPAAKLLPGEPDLQDFPTYVRILDEIVEARKIVKAEVKRIDQQYRKEMKVPTPQFERDDLEALEYTSHSEIVSKYGLKVCHVSVLREVSNALGYNCGLSFHAMEAIIAGRTSPEDKSYIGQIRKCSENGTCPAPKCEYRVETHG